MKLAKNSWIVKWAYLDVIIGHRLNLSDSYIPRSTSLCSIFWRSVLFVPWKLAVGAIIAPLIIIGTFIMYSIEWIQENFPRKQKHNNPSVMIEGIKSIKQKVCPIVEIV